MGWRLPWPRRPASRPVQADIEPDAWTRHVDRLAAHGIDAPGAALGSNHRRPATQADHAARYDVAPSFADLLPWVEYLPGSK